MVNHGYTSEDLVVNPLPTGQFTKVQTLVNYLLPMKVLQLLPFMAITSEWIMVSCGINNLCNSTTVNYLLQAVIPSTSITR
jgi:hypothetical protein